MVEAPASEESGAGLIVARGHTAPLPKKLPPRCRSDDGIGACRCHGGAGAARMLDVYLAIRPFRKTTCVNARSFSLR